ncbi:MAG: HAMP domain-containing protein [Deltaproteobacteria bacterium]|nr:HAMP domain-containing protein [Deltaproteobacteria bacterium]
MSIVLDLTFKVAIIPALPDLFGADNAATRADDLWLAVQCAAAWFSLWLVAFTLVVRRVGRSLAAAKRDPSEAALRRAGAHLHGLPMVASILWVIEWSMILVSAVVANGGIPSGTAALMFGAALVIGSYAVGHPLMVLLTGADVRGLSMRARERGVTLDAPQVTVRGRLVIYSLCLSLAPACYVASTTFANNGANMPYGRLLGLMVVCFAAVALFSAVCATLFAITITRPISEMANLVDDVTREQDLGAVGRVPTYLGDEIGKLSEATNAMIDRLASVAAARAAMHRALEALNRDLEARIQERTAHLQHANEELAAEMVKRSRVEIELRQAQKLEAVGRLAAGVAHEINTPVQFVSDSVHFVQDAMHDFAQAFEKFRALHQLVVRGEPATDAAAEASAAEESADLSYLFDNVPKALDRSLDGLGRVASIVRSMKELVHPGQAGMSSVDLNRAIENTLTVARHEYKLVADVETQLGELPLVTCHGDEVNQVLLNLIVNAAHAIGDVVAGTDARGRITLRTWVEGEVAIIAVQDTGTGIADQVRDRIFDPFFTTKEVGKGTGQGLAMAHAVVVEKHGGQLSFDTTPGKGTTFYVRLPIHANPTRAAA